MKKVIRIIEALKGAQISSIEYVSCQLIIFFENKGAINIEGFWRLLKDDEISETEDTLLSVQHDAEKLHQKNTMLSQELVKSTVGSVEVSVKRGDLKIILSNNTVLEIYTSHPFYQTWDLEIEGYAISSTPFRGIVIERHPK